MSEEKIILHGRGATSGYGEGEALVIHGSMGGWGFADPVKGVFIDGHNKECFGKSFAGKVLVFNNASGSSAWSMVYHNTRLNGVAPAAMVYNVTSAKAALGVVVGRIPAVTDLDRNPLELIDSGDYVRVDADEGTVEILKKAEQTKT